MLPWGDPNWYRGYNSPYYKASHHKLRAQVRAFVDKEIMPYCNQWDEAKALPRNLLKKCAAVSSPSKTYMQEHARARDFVPTL